MKCDYAVRSNACVFMAQVLRNLHSSAYFTEITYTVPQNGTKAKSKFDSWYSNAKACTIHVNVRRLDTNVAASPNSYC